MLQPRAYHSQIQNVRPLCAAFAFVFGLPLNVYERSKTQSGPVQSGALLSFKSSVPPSYKDESSFYKCPSVVTMMSGAESIILVPQKRQFRRLHGEF